jgi:hypothetical protein
MFFVKFHEPGIDGVVVEPALELGYVALGAEVAQVVVEHFIKDIEDGVFVGLGSNLCLLVDVEKDRLGRDVGGPKDITFEHFVVFDFRSEDFTEPQAIVFLIFQHIGEDFEEVRFTGTEEAGNPNAVHALIVVVILEEADDFFANFPGDYIFLHFGEYMFMVVGFDDSFNGPVNVFEKQVV